MFLSDDDRRIVPRWRDFRTTVSLGELTSITAKGLQLPSPDQADLEEKIRSWLDQKTLAFAADLAGAGLVTGSENNEHVQDAAREVVRARGMSSSSTLVANAALGEELEAAVGEQMGDAPGRQRLMNTIHILKARLAEDPRNPIAWVDIARNYAILGQKLLATRAMRRALILAPDSRFVLRSAARLYVHSGEPDVAHDLLRRRPVSRTDPWLSAAEIAVARVADRPPRLTKNAKEAISSGNFPRLHVSEAASALASLELESGNARAARRLFRTALEEPTDNTVAQADWASRKIGQVGIEPEHLQTPRSFEARAVSAYWSREKETAWEEAQLWMADEPFSVRPANFGSFVATTLLDDYAAGAHTARLGLASNPGEYMLRNNLVFALALDGKLAEAREVYDGMPHAYKDNDNTVAWLATGGLLSFREGKIDEGRFGYRLAAELAEGSSPSFRALAVANWAREELLESTPYALEVANRALSEASETSNPAVEATIDTVRELSDALRAHT